MTITEEMVRRAKKILETGSCRDFPCHNCPAHENSTVNMSNNCHEPGISVGPYGGRPLGPHGRNFFEQWLAAHDEPQKFNPENQYTLSNVSAREIINLNAQMAAFMQEYGVHCVRPLPGNRIESRASIRARLLDL
jgi:hypothetical protein